jgi:hypothetical protein
MLQFLRLSVAAYFSRIVVTIFEQCIPDPDSDRMGKLCFLLNGIVFMLIGLDLPEIVSGLGDTNISTAIGYGVAVTIVLILVRIFAGYAAVITTLIMRNFITVADAQSPGWQTPMIIRLDWNAWRRFFGRRYLSH